LVCPESAPVPSLVLFTELGRFGAWFVEDCVPQISSVEGQYDTALFRPTFRSTMYVCCACRPPGCCIIVGRWTFIPSIIAILHKLLNGSQSILIITAILLIVHENSSKRWFASFVLNFSRLMTSFCMADSSIDLDLEWALYNLDLTCSLAVWPWAL
jgi:hypothetical protein